MKRPPALTLSFIPGGLVRPARQSGRIGVGILVSVAFGCNAAAQPAGETLPSNPFPNVSIQQELNRVPVFFPPNPPPLGRSLARGTSAGGRFPAPPELAAYVSEFFYPPLGTRLATQTLGTKLRAQLEAYRASKLALQNELSAALDGVHHNDPAARLAALAALSQRQAPKIAELENTAEQLRRALISGDQDWNALRQWHLADKARRGFSPIELAQVMRAYAFYQDNLLPAQRRLLREISIELVFAAETTSAAAAAQPFLFFPPEPARVLLPDNIAAEVAGKIARFQTEKSALKKELYDVVCAADGAAFGFLKANPMKAIAGKQARRLEELENLAEDIRRGLAATPAPPGPRSPLPPSVDGRVGAMLQEFLRAQKEASARIDGILAQAKDVPLQASYGFEGENLKFAVVPTRRGRGPGGVPNGTNAARVEAVRAQIAAVADDYGRRMADMANEREGIRQEIGRSLGLTKPAEIDRALSAAMRGASQRESASAFADYQTAVFEPGLSPGQRRLLFDGVVERLELPLPRGELQPIQRGETW